ncbi:podocan-like isoform X2 [Callorhinchus milii]|uniref:podocan-like isoform X2 n=1 Tax=Callorhinchus milii TaxID=7868 RepID=UPI001C3FA380|nr:podocan-like isoform X2 [Callorhinchus milii]
MNCKGIEKITMEKTNLTSISSKTPETVTKSQEDKVANLQLITFPTHSSTMAVNERMVDKGPILGNPTVKPVNHITVSVPPIATTVTQSPNVSSQNNATINPLLLLKTSVIMKPPPTLPEKIRMIQSSVDFEDIMTEKLPVSSSLIPTQQPPENNTVSLGSTSSQNISNATVAIKPLKKKKKNLALKPGKKMAFSVPKPLKNDTITENPKITGRKNKTKVISKPLKQGKGTKVLKKRKKPRKQLSSKLKSKLKKPQTSVKPIQVQKKRQKKKKSQRAENKRRVEATVFPYFEDYYCPPECACYGRIVQCSDKGVDKMPYGIPFNTRNLFLMNNKIEMIQMGLLSEYLSLEFIVLNNNKLTDAGIEGALEGIEKLTRLYMDQNHLHSIPTDLPPTLEELMLNSNNISQMSAYVLAKCTSLKSISLNNNNITDESIPEGAFNQVQNLRIIKMNHNLLSVVPANLTTNLRELYLEGNQIIKIPDSVFANSSELTHLDLHNNHLNSNGIGDKAFLHMVRLEHLDLGKNALTSIPKQLPHSLKTLLLQENNLTSIRKNVLWNMSKLEEIHLEHNKISVVAAGAFRRLMGLRHLDISYNQLTRVPRQLPLTLWYLYLHNNQINFIPADSFCVRRRAESRLILVRLEKNNLDHRQVDVHSLKCLRGYQVIHFY